MFRSHDLSYIIVIDHHYQLVFVVEKRKLVQEEKVQDTNQITMGIHALTAHNVIVSSPKASMKGGARLVPL